MPTGMCFSNVKETLLESQRFHPTVDDWALKVRKPFCFLPELDRVRASGMCRAVCPTWTEQGWPAGMDGHSAHGRRLGSRRERLK